MSKATLGTAAPDPTTPGNVGGVYRDGVFILRPAQPADAASLVAIELETYAPGQQPSRDKLLLSWQERLAIEHGDDHFVTVVLGEPSQAPIAFVIAGGSRDPDGKAAGEIFSVAVALNKREQGIGSILVSHALKALAFASFESVTCWVRSDEEILKRFFIGRGFYEDARLDDTKSHGLPKDHIRFRCVFTTKNRRQVNV